MVHHDGVKALKEIDHFFKMKDGSVGNPEFYLGAKLRPITLPNGVVSWGMSSSKYIHAAVAIVKAYHAEHFASWKWEKRTSGPFPSDYAPELDTSGLLDPAQSTFFQSQIGVLRCIVELGLVDIITEVSELSSFLAMPREGHLDAVFHIFNYLDKRHNARIVFDPSDPEVDLSSFKDGHDWNHSVGKSAKRSHPTRHRHVARMSTCVCLLIQTMRVTNASDDHERAISFT